MAKKVTLISAEKLKEAFGDWIIDARYEHDIIATIDDQPEVEAIPTEWIKKHIIDIRAEVDRLIEEEDYTNYELCDDANGMERLLEDWRKENDG